MFAKQQRGAITDGMVVASSARRALRQVEPPAPATEGELNQPAASVNATGQWFEGVLGFWGPTVGQHLLPLDLQQPGAVKAIAGGLRHQVLLKSDGSVVAIGNNNPSYRQVETTPAIVRQPGAVKAIAAGKYHSLALMTDNTVQYWTRHIAAGVPPTEVTFGTNFASVHAGESSSFAITQDGVVYAWGEGVTGSRGEPLTDVLPTVMTGYLGVQDIVVTLRCGWMVLYNNGTFLNYTTPEGAPMITTPTVVQGVGNITASLRNNFVAILASMRNGHVVGWSRDTLGETSRPMAEVTDAMSVSSGTNTMVLRRNGSLVGYGENEFGNLNIPPGLGPAVAVSVGESYTLALLRDGSAKLWGKQRATVLPPGLTADTPIVRLAAGIMHFVVLTAGGQVHTWGPDFGTGELTVPPLNASDPVVDVGAGRNHSLLLLRSGRVVGFGLPGDEAVPAAARTNVQLVAGGCGFSVAVRSVEPRVVVWGQQDIITQCDLSTVPDFGNNSVSRLTVGCYHALALLSNSTVTAWGCNARGQASVPDSLRALPGGVRVVDLAAGDNHSVALLSNGRVVAWGDSSRDQYRASLINTVDNALAIGVGPNFTIVHRASNQLWFYGAALDDVPEQSLPTTGLDVNVILALTAGTQVFQLAGTRTSFAAVMLPPPAPAVEPSDGGSGGLSTNAVVGIAVGCALAAATVVAGWVWARRRGQHRAATLQADPRKRQPAAIPGLFPGEVFTRATAFEYSWLDGTATLAGAVPVEAGINDVQLDRQAVPADGTEALTCPVVQLSRDELKEHVHLLQGGLLGRGGTALCFQCVWPSRFGTGLLAAKVLKDGYEADVSVLQSARYEAEVLSTCLHPNVVRLYGYCLETPTVCLILELLPGSLKDVLYRGALTLEGSGLAVPAPAAKPALTLGPSSVTSLPGTHTGGSSLATSAFRTAFTANSEQYTSCAHTQPQMSTRGGPHTHHLSVHATAAHTTGSVGSVTTVASSDMGGHSTSTSYRTSSASSAAGFDTQYGSIKSAFPRTARSRDGEATGSTARTPLTMRQALHIMADVAAGLEYLHSATIEVSSDTDVPGVVEPVSLEEIQETKSSTEHSTGHSGAPRHPSRTKEARVVHRDLKPANILMNSLGRAKLSDFGLARRHQHTTVNTVAIGAGTIPYMSPEMLMGRSGGLHERITNRCDIYSVGMMMWELLAGRTPWSGMGEAAIVLAVVGRRRPELPSRADILRCKDNKPVVSEDAGSDADDTALPDADAADQVVPGGVSDSSTRNVADVPASLTALPELNDIIRACWQQRDLRRPTAAQLHAQLLALMQQSLGEEPSADALGEVVVPPEEPEHVSATPAAAHEITMEQRNNESS